MREGRTRGAWPRRARAPLGAGPAPDRIRRDERLVLGAMLIAFAVAAVAVWLAIHDTTRTSERLLAQHDAVTDARGALAGSRLLFEEAVGTGRAPVALHEVEQGIEAAHADCDVLRRGGRRGGIMVRAVRGDLATPVTAWCGAIGRFAATSTQRLANAETSREGSPAERDFDASFNRLDTGARAVEAGFDAAESANRRRIRWIAAGLIAGLVGLFGAVLAVVRRHGARLRRLLRENALILDAAGEGIYGVDREGRTVFMNPAAAAMTGHAPEELLGRRLHDVIHHRRPDGSPYPFEECPVTHALADGERRRVAGDVYWRKDGTSFPVEYTSAPIEEDGEIRGAVVVYSDVSERREAERAKDEFTSVVSHELRTPLTSIRGSLGLLAGGAVGAMPEGAQRMLDIAVGNTDRLVRLINDILDIERIESGRMEMTQSDCDVAHVVDQAVELLRPVAAEAGVRLDVAVPSGVAVHADPDRIVQTLTNLLSNAVKFSPADTVVRVAATDQGDDVLFCVRDEGRGIPADKRDAIFRRFEQVDASDARDKGGTGLGLAISRSIVAQHGGRIWVESEPGEGSAFFFTLPSATPRQPPGPGLPEQGVVLVCDDDASVRAVLKAILEDAGYRVLPAASGSHALELAAREPPDVVLLDLLMPERDGWATADALRADPATAHIPIVAVSVLPREEAGPVRAFDGYVQKPLDDVELLAALDRAVLRGNAIERVLVVEDDDDLAGVLCTSFERLGLQCERARDGYEAVERAGRLRPEVIVLDVGLPGRDGFAVVDELRRDASLGATALVVFTAWELDAPQRERLQLGEFTEIVIKGTVAPDEVARRMLALVRRMVRRRRKEEHAEAHPRRG